MKKRKLIRLGLIILILGISLISYEYFLAKRNYAFDYMNNKLYLSSSEMPEYIESTEDEEGVTTDEDTYDEDLTVEEITNNTNNTNTTTTPTNTNNSSASSNSNNNKNNSSKPKYYYIGYLEIPKIKFKRGFVDINSKDNDVSKNITIISGSKYPNVEKGNFIIAGHSGTGVHSYFKNLYKLTTGDEAYVYYKNVKYTYKIVKIYKQPKDGTIAIYRDYSKTTLTLVTCTKNDKTSQTIYVAELKSKESY